MDKVVYCNRCLFLRLAKSIKFQNNRCFHIAYPVCKQTHYEVLGVSKDATPQEIKAAFVRRSKEIHPDLNPDDPDNHDKFVLVNEAYNVLSKSKARREYDDMLQNPTRTTYTAPRPYYHGPGTSYGDFYGDFYHPSKAKDLGKGYYGMWGIKKRSNAEIAILMISFILLGSTGYVMTFFNSYKKRKEIEDEMYKENQRVYDEIRANARKFTTAEQLENFLVKSQQPVMGIYRRPGSH